VKNRLVEASKLVYLGHVRELAGIHLDGEARIGAGTTLRELSRSAVVADALPVLGDAAGRVGNPRVRSLATTGGALVHGDPRQDLPPVLLALSATAHLASASGTRSVPLSEFFLGFMETACAPDELVTSVSVPLDPSRRAHYIRYTPGSEDDYPTVGVAASVSVAPDGVVTAATLALGGVAEHALEVPDVSGLVGVRPDADALRSIGEAAAAAARPSDDQRGSAGYKRAMIEVMTRRAIEACLA
jgi:carbon-monoxide dehydrogenase medium subunit